MEGGYDSDGASDSGDIQMNECPIPSMSKELCESILGLKKMLYDAIIFGNSNSSTNNAQDNDLLNKYCTFVKEMSSILIKNLKCNNTVSESCEKFPESVRDGIKNISKKLCDEVMTLKSPVDIITYVDFIHTNLCIYPYVHKNMDS